MAIIHVSAVQRETLPQAQTIITNFLTAGKSFTAKYIFNEPLDEDGKLIIKGDLYVIRSVLNKAITIHKNLQIIKLNLDKLTVRHAVIEEDL